MIDNFRQWKQYYPIDKNLQIGAEKAFEVAWHPLQNPYDVWAKYLPRKLETRGEQVIDPEGSAFKIFSLQWYQTGGNLKLVFTLWYKGWKVFYPPVFTLLEEIGRDWENVQRDISMLVQELGYDISSFSLLPSFSEQQTNILDKNEDISAKLPDRKKELDTLCIKWVNRGYMPKTYNMSEFLAENQITWVTVPEFKRALRDACNRGIIAQDSKTKRYKPK